jgi:hypothetical protein
MVESGFTARATMFKPFEGMWLSTRPSGAIACAKIIDGVLLIPYSLSEARLAGHHYDCRVVEETLFGRFEQFDSAVSGVWHLKIGANQTLSGGRWMTKDISEAVRRDITSLSDSLPGMQPTVWIRMPNAEIPEWAENYFREDWPNKQPRQEPSDLVDRY